MQTAKSYGLLTVLCLLLYLPGISTVPIVDRDAPHFAQATKQMLQTNNYLQVKFQDKPRHLKPPGIYWLQAIFVKALSHAYANTVWPYRIPSLLGGLLAVLLTVAFTRRCYNDKIAVLAAALLVCSLLLVIESHLAVTDSVLLAAMVLMQGSLWVIYHHYRLQQKIGWALPLLFWFAVSAGILIKGITPLVGGLTIITLLIVDRSSTLLKYTRFSAGFVLMIGLTLLWLIPVSIAGGSNFLYDMIHGDVMPKLVGGQQSHGMPPGYFTLIFAIMFWPGSLFFWHAAQWAWRNRTQTHERFLLAWFIPTWLFFEIIPTKLPEYVLPIYPAMAIITAKAIYSDNLNAIIGKFRYVNYTYYAIWALYSLGLAGFIIFVPYHIDKQISMWSLFSAAVIIGGAAIALYYCINKRLLIAAKVLIAASVFYLLPLYQWVLPNIDNLWVTEKVVAAINTSASKALSAKRPLLSVGYGEPSLVFALGTHHVLFTNYKMAVHRLTQNRKKALGPQLILVNQRLASLFMHQALVKQLTVKQLATIDGYDYSNGKWVKLNLYESGKRQ